MRPVRAALDDRLDRALHHRRPRRRPRSSPWAGSPRHIPRRDRARCGLSGARTPWPPRTVIPCSPTSCSASFTSSSLKGLMTASIFFIAQPHSAHVEPAHGSAQRWRSRVRGQRAARYAGGSNGSQARSSGCRKRARTGTRSRSPSIAPKAGRSTTGQNASEAAALFWSRVEPGGRWLTHDWPLRRDAGAAESSEDRRTRCYPPLGTTIFTVMSTLAVKHESRQSRPGLPRHRRARRRPCARPRTPCSTTATSIRR